MKWKASISSGDHTIVAEGPYNIYRIYLTLKSQDRPFYELCVCGAKTQTDYNINTLVLWAEENEKKLRLSDESAEQEEELKEKIIEDALGRIPTILQNNGF